MKLLIDEYVVLKKQHGRIKLFTRAEGAEWEDWKHEYGMPRDFHSVMFEDMRVWDEVNGLRPEKI